MGDAMVDEREAVAVASSQKPVDSDRVWTAVITNLDYLPGLLTLAHSLRLVKSSYPLIALTTPSFPPEGHAALARRSIPAIHVPYLQPSQGGRDYANDPRFHDCWTKLVPFSLVQFRRVVQLDADMLVRRNMDELMTLPLDEPEVSANGSAETGSKRVFAAGHACLCNPLKKPHYPRNWIPSNCAFTTQHGTPDEAQTIAPPTSASPLGFVNGGLQVVNPSTDLYAQILKAMNEGAADMEFADQSLLSELYRDRWVPLPYVYNALKTLRWKDVHSPIWRDDQVKNVHYILSPKPWDEMDKDGNFIGEDESHKWWVDVNKERKAAEKQQGVADDGF